MQQQLFDTQQTHPAKGLVILKGSKNTLTKNQQAFNKLTQKIERLHNDIERQQLEFDKALKIYGNEIHPIQCRLETYRRQLVTILWDVYKSKKLSKTDQRHIKNILKEHVLGLCANMEEGPDHELKKMYAELEGESFEKVQEREKEIMKTQMEDFFEDMDLDLGGMDMNDEEAVMEKIAQIEQKLREEQEQKEQQNHQRKKKKKLTPKQEAQEHQRKAVDEMKQKNISTIYKQLAKLFHPDLEHDEERRAEKEILMKELTAAYETKNLHTLLMLELKWIHKENDHLESLSDEKLTIYLQILREQARDLEQQINTMFDQPRYAVLVQEFGLTVQRWPVEKVKEELRYLKNIDVSFKRDLENFQSPNGIRFIKAMINEWKATRQQNKYSEEEELINMILGQQF